MSQARIQKDPQRPVYVISVAASIVAAHPRTLRIYEDEGLICPARTPTNIRLYSDEDIRRITWIRHLTRERGVNLAGIRLLFELEERLGTRILEALYDEGVRRRAAEEAAGRDDRQPARHPWRLGHAPTGRSVTPSQRNPLLHDRPPRPMITDTTHRRPLDGQASDTRPGRSADHHTESSPSRAARAAARRPPRDRHLPGDDRPAPGRPREVRQRPERRRRRRRPDRARHPAPRRAGGHRVAVRALRRRDAGEDRPGRPAPGRHRPGDRPGPDPPEADRLRRRTSRICARPSRSSPTRPAAASRSRP